MITTGMGGAEISSMANLRSPLNLEFGWGDGVRLKTPPTPNTLLVVLIGLVVA